MGDPVGRAGEDGDVAARKLVAALGASLDILQAAFNRKIDGLVIAGLEMQHRAVVAAPPVAAIERVGTDQVHGARDGLAIFHGEDEEQVIGHALAQQGETETREIGRAPFAAAGVDVEMVEGVEMIFGDRVACQVDEGEAVLRFCALLAQVLALGGRKRGEEIVEAFVAVIHPTELLVGARQEAGIGQGLGVVGIDEIDVKRGELVLLGELDGTRQERRLELGLVGALGHETAAAGDGGEGHGGQQFRVVGSARTFIGVGPALVEHELAA